MSNKHRLHPESELEKEFELERLILFSDAVFAGTGRQWPGRRKAVFVRSKPQRGLIRVFPGRDGTVVIGACNQAPGIYGCLFRCSAHLEKAHDKKN
jgi:hypothetical protein